MNTCKTCKWWSKKNPHWGMMQGNVNLHLRVCLWERCDDTWRTQDAVCTLDSEGIYTGPNFGCIHYEETQKEGEATNYDKDDYDRG